MEPVVTLKLVNWHHPMLEPYADGSYVMTGGSRALWRVVATRPDAREIDLAPVKSHSAEALEAFAHLTHSPQFPRELPLPYEVVSA